MNSDTPFLLEIIGKLQVTLYKQERINNTIVIVLNTLLRTTGLDAEMLVTKDDGKSWGKLQLGVWLREELAKIKKE